jgi:hypothetical protein
MDVLEQARVAVMEVWTALPAEEKGPYTKILRRLVKVTARRAAC